MRALHFRKCVKLLDLGYPGYRSHRKALAKALGVKIRSIDRYHADIRRARALCGASPPLLPGEGRGEGTSAASAATDSRSRTKRRRKRADPPLPLGEGRGEGLRLAPKDLLRLARIDQLLQLEYSGYQATISELAAMFHVSQPTLFRDLCLIEAVRGSHVKLVPRRKKRTK